MNVFTSEARGGHGPKAICYVNSWEFTPFLYTWVVHYIITIIIIICMLGVLFWKYHWTGPLSTLKFCFWVWFPRGQCKAQ
uniref:Uncharacterized protein n=1 Tax=Anguilla anguilla TaxID=7936 RepID=A0A0E9WIT0_ANGAN